MSMADFIDDYLVYIVIGIMTLLTIYVLCETYRSYVLCETYRSGIRDEADRICNALGYETYVTYGRDFLGFKPKNLVCGNREEQLFTELASKGVIRQYVVNNETIYVGDFGIIKKADEKR